jgi:drug/metabolite transporter (DMT)-like permease
MDYLALLAAAVIWGGNAIVSKASASVIAPGAMAFWRWVLAIVLLTPFVARGLYANRPVIRRQLPRLVILGLLGFAAFPGLMYVAARFTSAIHIGIIQALMPLLVLGISIALLGHRLTQGAVVGGILSLAGVVLVVSHGQPAALFSGGVNEGDLLMLGAAVCYAVYIVLLKGRGRRA